MSTRSRLAIVGGAVGCSLLLLCLFVAVVAGYTYFVPMLPQFATGKVDRIAYVDNDANIQLVDARGEQRIALTTDASESNRRFYLFPTWSPDSQRIAFIGTGGTNQAREDALYTLPWRGGNRVTVYQSTLSYPFYLYWSPDSQRIGFLAQGDAEMSLMLGQADGKKDAQKVETGSPFYWAWSPNSQSLLMHIGGSRRDSSEARLALWRWQETSSPKALAHSPSDFEAPQYSPDGTMILYAAMSNSGEDALYVADAQDTNARSITQFSGHIAFAWSPDGKKIGWIVTDADTGFPNLGRVMVSDADGSHSKQATTDDALAFYWSPDSQRIAYLTVTASGSRGCLDNCGRSAGLSAPLPQDQTVHLQWRVVNMADVQIHTLATFDPTGNFLLVLPYFDQYARSMTFWSPDSQRFVYTQDESDGNGSVWVADVTGKEPARKIGDGTLGVWSWR